MLVNKVTLAVALLLVLSGASATERSTSALAKEPPSSVGAAKAESDADRNDVVCLQVFFATTRQWNGKTFSSSRGNGASHDFGQANYSLEKKLCRQDIRDFLTRQAPVTWRFVSADTPSGVGSIDKHSSVSEFLSRLDEASTMSLEKEIVVWVHGYFNNFNDSIAAASMLESYLKRPVIAYSWPSTKGKLPSKGTYREAVGNAEWNQEAFTSFLRLLNARFPGKVVLICHSMGSRLVAGALHDLHDQNVDVKFAEVIFASPDFDSHTFVNRYANAMNTANKVRIYINPGDKALGKSEDLWGGHSRVGRPGDDVGMLTELPNTQVIDFTTFGAGILGHDVPFSLISSMHVNSRPGKGWLLQSQPLKLIRSDQR